MAEAETPSNYTPGYWLWDDPDHGGYTKFDDATSKQIEDRLKEAITAKTKGPIEVSLSAGPWFGLQKNKGVYSCVLIVDCTDTSRPIIQQARQTNTNSGYKRPIKRHPPLDPPLEENLQKLLDELEGKWEWKDDYGWKEYDLETMAQIEEAFHKKLPKVELSAGSFFSKQEGTYYIEFNYLSLPASAQQHNRKSHYGRWVRRIPVKNSKKEIQKKKQEAFMVKSDKHFLWKKYYAALSIEDFQDQKNDAKLKSNLKCSICLSEFEEKDLLENQRGDQVAKFKQAITDNDDNKESADKPDKSDKSDKTENDDNNNNQGDNAEDDEKSDNNVRKHRFDLSKARAYVSDSTIIGLTNCSYGHYFHAECILPQLNAKQTCPLCTYPYGVIIGHQPDGRLYVTKARARCSGFNDAKDSIKMLFEFPGGIQGEHHPNPGKIYFGDLREAFLPNNREGREAAMLTRLAFQRKLIFQIGTSLTLQQDNRIVFGSIHLKTSTTGGNTKHGFPDDEYFSRFKQELKVKGITTALLDDDAKKFIEQGFPKPCE